MNKSNALKRLVTLAGGVKNLSKILGIPEMTIYGWVRYGQISIRGFVLALQSSIIPREMVLPLRPDLDASAYTSDDLDADDIEAMKAAEKTIGDSEEDIPLLIWRDR